MLSAVIIDGNAISRDLLNSVLTQGGHQVLGQTHNAEKGLALVKKFLPHFVCIDIDQIDDETNILSVLRKELPKVLIFLVSSEIDAKTVQDAVARGVHGFIVKPFNATSVLSSIRNTVLATIKKHSPPKQGKN